MATFPVLSAVGFAATGNGARKALKVEQLPSRAVLPSVDLHLAMGAKALGLLKQIQAGTQTYASLASGAGLMHHYAEHLHTMEIDEHVKAIAKAAIGQTPQAASAASAKQLSDALAKSGVTPDSAELEAMLTPSQQAHDAAMRQLSKHGASPVYHALGDLLEAGASWVSSGASHAVSVSATAAAARFEQAVWHGEAADAEQPRQGGAHLLRVQNSCKVPPKPPPPSWCPNTTAMAAAKTLFNAVGAAIGAAVSGAAADLDSLMFCTDIALEAATIDTATDGLGLLLTPFEVWACTNSQAIIAQIQNKWVGGSLGAFIGNLLYGELSAFVKDHGCPT